MFGHLFDDEPRAGGAGRSGSEDEGSLLSSGEEEEGSDGPDGWSEEEEDGGSGSEEEGAGGRGRGRRRQPDELDELFGQVRIHCSRGALSSLPLGRMLQCGLCCRWSAGAVCCPCWAALLQ